MIVSTSSGNIIETKSLTTMLFLTMSMERHEKSQNQQMVYHLIPDTMFVRMNEVADSIAVAKKVAINNANKSADRIASEKIYNKFSDIAKGLIMQPEIVYKGNQRFNLEEVEFADSMVISKKGNKGVRRNSKNHSAKCEVIVN